MIPFLIAVLFAIVSTASPELPSAPEDTFSFAVIPDTQRYKWKGTRAEPESEAPVTNAVFDTYTKWIQANIEPQRIVFVSHVGDIVDRNVLAQWDVARNAMDRLHGRIPYRISVENHDMTRSGDSSLFQQYFPAPGMRGSHGMLASSRQSPTSQYPATMPTATSCSRETGASSCSCISNATHLTTSSRERTISSPDIAIGLHL